MRKRKPLPIKTCEWCEKEYQTTRGGGSVKQRKFCGAKCRDQSYKFSRTAISRAVNVKTKREADAARSTQVECNNPECGNVFRFYKHQKYCSKKCAMRRFEIANPARRLKKKKPCHWCGGKIPSGGRTNRLSKYCSVECGSKGKQRDAIKAPAKKICVWCGVKFIPTPKAGTKECCSDECKRLERNRWFSGNTTRKKIKKLTALGYEVDSLGKITKECRECGSEFKAKRTYDFYCSKVCQTGYHVRQSNDTDYYYRGLLSRVGLPRDGRGKPDIPLEFWSDDLVQAKKAEVRLRRTILQQQQQQKGKHD